MDVTKMNVGELVKEFDGRKKRGSKDDLIKSLCDKLSNEKLRLFLEAISSDGEGSRWIRKVEHELERRARAIFQKPKKGKDINASRVA